jgi:hypothetical protein
MATKVKNDVKIKLYAFDEISKAFSKLTRLEKIETAIEALDCMQQYNDIIRFKYLYFGNEIQ